jgi:hypothetical protein
MLTVSGNEDVMNKYKISSRTLTVLPAADDTWHLLGQLWSLENNSTPTRFISELTVSASLHLSAANPISQYGDSLEIVAVPTAPTGINLLTENPADESCATAWLWGVGPAATPFISVPAFPARSVAPIDPPPCRRVMHITGMSTTLWQIFGRKGTGVAETRDLTVVLEMDGLIGSPQCQPLVIIRSECTIPPYLASAPSQFTAGGTGPSYQRSPNHPANRHVPLFTASNVASGPIGPAIPLCSGAVLTASLTNADVIRVGHYGTIATDETELDAGESIFIAARNLAHIFAIGAVAGLALEIEPQ